jgi:hypothetical protein
MIALLDGVAEAGSDISLAVAVEVLQGDEESPWWGRVVAVVSAAPGIDIDHAVRGYHQVACMADMVGEDCCAEACR